MSSLSRIDSEVSFRKLINIKIKWKLLRSLRRYGPSSILYLLGLFFGIISFLLRISILDVGLFIKAILFIFFIFSFSIFLKFFKYKHFLLKIARGIRFNIYKNLNKWNSLNRQLKFIRLVILIVYFALFYIIIKMILKDFNLSYFIILFMYSSLILFSIGFILEAIKVGKLYWNQSIIKNILRLFGIIATTLALVVSRHSINLITKIDSSHFPIAISIFTFLLTPFAWMFLVIMFLFLFYTIISILMPFRLTVMQFKFVIEFILLIRNHRIFCFLFWMNKMNCASSRTNFLLIWPARAAGAITIGYYSVQLIVLIASNSFLYQQQIYTFISKGIVYSSYHSISSECKNHIRGEWIALIGDNKASIAKINNLGSFDFEIRSCE